MSCFGHNTQKTDLLGPQWNDFTLSRHKASFYPGISYGDTPWGISSLCEQTRNLQPPPMEEGFLSKHFMWPAGQEWSLGSRIKAEAQAAACGYLLPCELSRSFCKSENVCNQNLQDCPGFVSRCNLRWDTDLHNFRLSYLLSSLSACYFWEQ